MFALSVSTLEVVPPDGAASDERTLVAAARKGDRAAAERLVELSYSTVFASLVKMCNGDRDLAADLTQETYRKAWESLRNFDGRARFSTWLYRIAYTSFLNYIRRPNRLSAIDDQKVEPEDPSPDARSVVQEREEQLRLRRAVLTLGEEHRFTVTAHFWGDLSVRDIAEAEGVTTVAIRKRLEKAYRLLQQALEKDRS